MGIFGRKMLQAKSQYKWPDMGAYLASDPLSGVKNVECGRKE